MQIANLKKLIGRHSTTG